MNHVVSTLGFQEKALSPPCVKSKTNSFCSPEKDAETQKKKPGLQPDHLSSIHAFAVSFKEV